MYDEHHTSLDETADHTLVLCAVEHKQANKQSNPPPQQMGWNRGGKTERRTKDTMLLLCKQPRSLPNRHREKVYPAKRDQDNRECRALSPECKVSRGTGGERESKRRIDRAALSCVATQNLSLKEAYIQVHIYMYDTYNIHNKPGTSKVRVLAWVLSAVGNPRKHTFTPFLPR